MSTAVSWGGGGGWVQLCSFWGNEYSYAWGGGGGDEYSYAVGEMCKALFWGK